MTDWTERAGQSVLYVRDMNIMFISLGCDKNLVDSERMLGKLKKTGARFTDDETKADVIIINTCCFIDDAKEESIEQILRAAQLKKDGSLKGLVVCGCMAARYRDEITKEIPEVDAILGPSSADLIADALDCIAGGASFSSVKDADIDPVFDEERMLSSPGPSGYLKIAEGCDKHCTYCVIPSIRGRYRSYPMEELLRQAHSMARAGVKELILVAQETTLYGTDLYGKKSLHILLRNLSEIEGIEWIRLLYCYPEEIYDDLIHEIRDNKKVCRYLDVPVQHASDDILRRMNRKTDGAKLSEIIERLRCEIPDIVLRTTLISGFPGESERDHRILLDFVRKEKFDRLGVFAYSREEGTPAAQMPDQVDEAVKEKRRDEIMLAQQDIAFEKAREKEGTVCEALIEGYLPDDLVYVGRTRADAPDIDGVIFVESERELMTGDIVSVMVTGANGYDLTGRILD